MDEYVEFLTLSGLYTNCRSSIWHLPNNGFVEHEKLIV